MFNFNYMPLVKTEKCDKHQFCLPQVEEKIEGKAFFRSCRGRPETNRKMELPFHTSASRPTQLSTRTHAHLHEHTSFHGSWTWNMAAFCGFEPAPHLKWLSSPLHNSMSPCLHTFAQWSTCCRHEGAHHSLINKSWSAILSCACIVKLVLQAHPGLWPSEVATITQPRITEVGVTRKKRMFSFRQTLRKKINDS